ncbi:helix-turn-helix domain-containing protein [Peribacillus castrilensis]|uniref:Transcriptional regulator n=1 Tax=Peribacillus simplex TaxID=1478 RepID=A0AAN2PIL8_9BACI|nr:MULTISPECIES: helix-turn-helix transcriptional regulator [Bacillaceae]MCF7620430.1 helix-turn-helix domain-containing protein [Peribacillus frigoritolerans]MCP1155984.1 helix-turn-helix domain-containing protein [Peribacillus frigoritolerans]MCT1391223.1 helix-turn-helix domain-containing protein [Peribacillus frigoritolerans]PAL07457.1 transcriptional regulator [Peribacillus simplex]PRA86874.1 XRE family transcriptional regulator [Peribacillus simplex]
MLQPLQTKFLNVMKTIFPDYPQLFVDWNMDINHLMSGQDDYQPSQTLKAFFVILDSLVKDYGLKFEDMEQWVDDYIEEIRNFVLPYIQIIGEENSAPSPKSNNREVINALLNQNFAESGSALLFHKLRETISKNEFDIATEIPTARIAERALEATAQVRAENDYLMMKSNVAIEQWKNLTSQAITSMDDLTADIFDIVSILWMQQATHKDQMIHFHTDDALNLRRLQGRKEDLDGYQMSYRKKERDDIMKRLAALTTIWIRIEKENLRFINEDQGDFEEIGQVQFNPLFLVDSVTVAYRGDNPIGIYECSIRPGELLANFLYGSQRSSGLLALKTLEYHPIKQKYHKRLSRYLSWQWRIRQKSADYLRAYHIGGDKGLLKVMDLDVNPRYGSRIREQFEEILDTLQQDGIIKGWSYKETTLEKQIEQERNWFANTWLKARVQIIPPTEITGMGDDQDLLLIEDQDYDTENFLTMLKGMTDRETGATKEMVEEKQVSPETINKERTDRGLSILEAAKEMGISHSTLSRYERTLIKRPYTVSLEKMKEWLNAK